MPELPDISIYREALEKRVVGQRIDRVRIRGAFFLRTFDPPIEAVERREVRSVSRLGKRLVFALDGDLFIALHLMIAGRLRWADAGGAPVKAGSIEQGSFEFPSGTLTVTEAGTKKRASLHLVHGEDAVRTMHRGGIDVLTCGALEFIEALRRENHTLKRSLTDPRLFDGIGNAYSDEILHAARLSPILLTSKVSDAQASALLDAARGVLIDWTERLRRDFGLDNGAGRFPGAGEITAFRPEFAVHGKFGRPCPVCGHPVQRIVHAENETNYCAGCQTSGRVLADRSLSRLLKDDWPRRIEDVE